MKKLLIAFLLVAGVVGSANAIGDIEKRFGPRSINGDQISPWYGGYTYRHISGTTEVNLCYAPCMLVDIMMATGPLTAYVKIRDTDHIGHSYMQAFPLMYFSPVMDTYSRTPHFRYPVRAAEGWTIALSGVAVENSVTVLYMEY